MSDPSMESSLTYENCSIFNQSANFSNPPYNIAGQKYETHEETLKAVKEKFWFTYRSNFEPLIDPKILKENEEAKEKVKEKVSDDEKILDSPDLKKSLEETSSYLSNYMNSYTGDAGWGCAVRVGQMLFFGVGERRWYIYGTFPVYLFRCFPTLPISRMLPTNSQHKQRKQNPPPQQIQRQTLS